jgi:transaldolase
LKIFLDTADIDQIVPAYNTGLIDGVTTNPSLILKSGRELLDVVKEIYDKCPQLESISAEVVGDTAGEMLMQAQRYYSIAPSVTIKVPCTVDGLDACRQLSTTGIKTNVTLVFSVAQAILAGKAGATYISPFVGRWIDNSVDGIQLLKNIRTTFDNSSWWKKVVPQILGASIRDVYQVEKAALAGTDIVTIPPKVFWDMYENALTNYGLKKFNEDYQEALKFKND